MFTNSQQLKKNLQLISRMGSRTENASVVQFDYNSNKKYKAQIVCFINCRYTDKYYNWYAKEWINKFSLFMGSPWKQIRKSSSDDAKYTKVYKCNTEVRHSCISRIVFKVTDQDQSSHKIFIAINLHCRSVVVQKSVGAGQSQSTIDHNKPGGTSSSNIHHTFFTYFSNSYTTTTAKMYHSLVVLINKFENKGNVLPEQTMNPTMKDVLLFWQTWKTTGADKCIDLEEIMERKKVEIDEMGVLMRAFHLEMVVLITPTMKRVLTLHDLDVVIVSSTTVPQGPQTTLFFVPSKIGALCFACVLHQRQTQEAYKEAFIMLKSTIESEVKKSFRPQSLVVHDSDDLILAIKEVFENSKVMIAPWSLCRDLWTFMCSGKTLEAVCHTTMAAFHEIVQATDAKSAHLRFIKFTASTEFKSLTQPLRKYIEEVWEKNRLRVWCSSANNSLIELSVTLIQQLLTQKCDSFNIINMCDAITTLDKHFKQLIKRWISKTSMLKMHTRFLKTLDPSLNTWEVIITPPHQFLLTNGSWRITVRTDTWCCSCLSGKRALYCEHLCAIMDVADVIDTLTDDERDLLKQIAEENNDDTEYNDDNCDVDSEYPPYSDGYYVFQFPMDVTIEKSDQTAVENEINDTKTKTLENTNNIYKNKIRTFADLHSIRTVNREAEHDIGNEINVIDICTKPISPKRIKQEEPFHVKDELLEVSMEVESADTQNAFFSPEINHENITINAIKQEPTDEFMNIERSDVENTDLCGNKNLHEKKYTRRKKHTIEPKGEEMFFIEIDIKNRLENTQSSAFSNQENDKMITETDSLNVNSENNNLLASNCGTEYKTAVDSLSKEFKRLDDCLSSRPSSSKLASIMRLTNELSRATMELQYIKRELEDSTK